MGSTKLTSLEGFERQPFEVFAENAYLNYSMYVILDRALPYIGDGLKPVQRRIIYAMSQLGLSSGAKYKKSARTVGDVLGKYHPHGDSACYEAMVLLAQPFSCRYPLLDGQGNWGAPDDPKSFAAMRYTESKLSRYADVLLSELDLGATEWTVNFDGTLNEPTLMPARLPNILLNGTTGIAVGMATDIPPHNLNEVSSALVHLLDHPGATLDKICEFIQGPDYPTEAEIITPSSEIREMYLTGNGRIRMRAKYHVDDGDIVVTALPHHSSGEKILEQIAAQMQAKKLPMVVDLRDESDHEEPTRLVIIPKARTNTTALMDHLFATTDLERSYRINMNMIGTNGRPEVKPLLTVLSEWLAFRIDTVRKRLEHRLEKVNDRIHLLDGLLTAFLNIDEIIAIIRNNDEPKPVLMETFNLSDRQATAILEIKLRNLAKLEEIKIQAEKKSLDAERLQIEKILASDKRLRTLIKKEIQSDTKKHGDERRSPIFERKEAEAFSEEEVIQVEPMTVILSKTGWVRAAKGHDVDVEKLKFKSGDDLFSTAPAMSNRPAVFLDSTGRSYSLPVHTLASARTMGEPLTGRLTVKPEAHISGLITGDDEDFFLLYTDTGFGFITQFSNLTAKSRTGKAVLTLDELANLMPPLPVKNPATDLLTAITTSGRMIIFPVKEMPTMEKGKGNKIIGIPKNQLSIPGTERIKVLEILPEGAEIVIYAGKHFLKLTTGNQTNYRSKRGYRGKRLPRGFQNVNRLEVIPSEK